ncbi:HNH endonuclease signature motif containing protein [Methylibium sp.]|uniref:HNH endonuclease signature motif containing protein n=1 Tax=Methylibium sp. TaxID=2067992 RepID=UPI0017F08BC8|nr:HNH endonuclease signature motif containing protein [Methylibium sp.]MBA3589672.1 HNH endonuclease [Methylibium sp.]
MQVTVISATCQEFMGVRFYLCGHYYQHRGRRLHRAVWEAANTKVPQGYHVHHVDHDRSNNQPGNLALRRAAEHLSEHMREPERIANARRYVKRAIAAAPAWHATEEGLDWHSKHAKEQTQHHTDKTVRKKCDHCGKAFVVTRLTRTSARFCHNNCKSAWRRASGIDDITRECAVCGKSFVIRRYLTTKTCGPKCGAELRTLP